MAGLAPCQSKHQQDEELPSPTSSLILGSSWLPNFRQSTVCVFVIQSCATLCNSVDGSLAVHGVLQARILEWVAISFSKGSS